MTDHTSPTLRDTLRAELAVLIRRARSDEGYLTIEELAGVLGEGLDEIERVLLASHLETYDTSRAPATRTPR
jgi:hypothetical protein